ncbi:hypothetical protein O181_064869 [Austropuccinia psidii MF-1]|uniref:DUF4939 domain-containing protein n=1 Tax=Austropuccinia psidii MF-1 TaxID=1389203 RepID=A0A9Q3EQE0_9BASI|nr:hypothetical protein [Austropuccinia psidii MF-1]
MKGEAQSRKEGRGPRRSSTFSGVVGTSTGISRTTLKGTGEDDAEEEENSKMKDLTSEPSSLAIMQQMTHIMANIQAASYSEALRLPAFKTPPMKAQDFFDGTQPFKVRVFIQPCQLVFHNGKENFSEERDKVIYATSFLIGRDSEWIDPYLSDLTNQDPAYLINKWAFFKSQLFKLFENPNGVKKS